MINNSDYRKEILGNFVKNFISGNHDASRQDFTDYATLVARSLINEDHEEVMSESSMKSLIRKLIAAAPSPDAAVKLLASAAGATNSDRGKVGEYIDIVAEKGENALDDIIHKLEGLKGQQVTEDITTETLPNMYDKNISKKKKVLPKLKKGKYGTGLAPGGWHGDHGHGLDSGGGDGGDGGGAGAE